MNTTHADGNQHERDLRGNKGADRTAGDDTRDKSLAFSRAEAAEQQVKELRRILDEEREHDAETIAGLIAQTVTLEADRDHAREERDKLQRRSADLLTRARKVITANHNRIGDHMRTILRTALAETANKRLEADLHSAREELATLKAEVARNSFVLKLACLDHDWTAAKTDVEVANVAANTINRLDAATRQLTSDLYVASVERNEALAENSRLQPYVQHLRTCARWKDKHNDQCASPRVHLGPLGKPWTEYCQMRVGHVGPHRGAKGEPWTTDDCTCGLIPVPSSTSET